MSLEVQIRRKLNSYTLDVHFESKEGILALLGTKGTGKTMTLRCIAGLEKPDEGRIALNGRVLFDSLKKTDMQTAKRRVGCLLGEYGLFPFMTVDENIRMALLGGGKAQLPPHSGTGSTALMPVISEYLDRYHLSGLGGYYPRDLSGAQQFWASYARVMASSPELLLMDDPFAGLDRYLAAGIMREVREDLERRKILCIFASADRDEVYGMGRTVCVLHRGQSEVLQSRENFFADPETVTGAVLTGCTNISGVRLMDPTHAVSSDWGQIFCYRVRENMGIEDSALGGETTPGGLTHTDAEGIRWREFPIGTAAAGIRPTDLAAASGQETAGEFTRFTVHAPRVEEDLSCWNVYFRPAIRSGCEMLWSVPKTAAAKDGMDRESLAKVRTLVVRNDKILWLRK